MQFKTVEEAQKAYDTLETEHADVKEKLDLTETEKGRVIKESMSRKNTIKELTEAKDAILKTLEDAGLEFEDGDEFTAEVVKGALEKTKAAATKGTKPDSEVEKILKKMETLSAELTAAKTEREQEKAKAQLEKARSAFLAKVTDQFQDPEIVIDHAISRNLLSLDENGNPVIKQGDEFVPLVAEKGPTAVDVLKKLYPKQAITQQRGGGKDTRSSGDGSTRPGAGGLKEYTLKEFNELGHVEKQAAVEEIKTGKAKMATE